MSTPQSNIYICSGVRLDNRQQHTIHFRTEAEQQEYFAGKVVKTFSAYSYHRRNWKLKVEASMAQAQQWNYLYITQPGSPDRQYYFINAVNYLSDSTVELDLELDVLQTYMGKYSMLPCFVERTHTDDDTPGANTVPEGLELGPYTTYHQWDMEEIKDMCPLVLSAVDLQGIWESRPDFVETAPAQVYNGVYSAMSVYAYPNLEVLTTRIRELDATGKSDAVVAIWMYPKRFLILKESKTSTETMTWAEMESKYPADRRGVFMVAGVVGEGRLVGAELAPYTQMLDKVFGGYTPKNKKLYTHPYNMLYCTNNAGEKAEYKFEQFAGDFPRFVLYSAIGPDASVKLCPDEYNINGALVNYEEGISMGTYPNCAWNSDSYKVWLAQNYNQLKHSETTSGLTALAGVATAVAGVASYNPMLIGSGAAMAFSGVNQIAGLMAQREDAQAQPPQAKGSFSATVNVCAGRQTFSFYYKCIREEYARQIDDFLTMYGYKTNRIMTPNPRVRKGFTYIKTVGCKITGFMSGEDMTHIQNIFDNGITFWTDGDEVGNYAIDNSL